MCYSQTSAFNRFELINSLKINKTNIFLKCLIKLQTVTILNLSCHLNLLEFNKFQITQIFNNSMNWLTLHQPSNHDDVFTNFICQAISVINWNKSIQKHFNLPKFHIVFQGTYISELAFIYILVVSFSCKILSWMRDLCTKYYFFE